MPRIQLATGVGAIHGAVQLSVRMATTTGHGGGEEEKINQPQAVLLGIAVALVVAGGIFAGYVCLLVALCCEVLNEDNNDSLTIGLMGLDELNLRVLAAASDDETEKKNAAKVCGGGGVTICRR